MQEQIQKFAHPIKFGKDPKGWKKEHTTSHQGEENGQSNLAELQQDALAHFWKF